MIVYAATRAEFTRDVYSNIIEEKITRCLYDVTACQDVEERDRLVEELLEPAYDFRVFDSPHALRSLIVEKNKARLVAKLLRLEGREAVFGARRRSRRIQF